MKNKKYLKVIVNPMAIMLLIHLPLLGIFNAIPWMSVFFVILPIYAIIVLHYLNVNRKNKMIYNILRSTAIVLFFFIGFIASLLLEVMQYYPRFNFEFIWISYGILVLLSIVLVVLKITLTEDNKLYEFL
ncbi:MAG: hypothetical protein FWE36_04805 [Erysipelotrichales bacterium]|nr:hypothetical protein [Erysipelotrichales bacterium]